MSYELQPGTIAFLCAKHLRTLAPGVELSTAELSAALGQPSSSLLPATQAARNHGLIRARYRDDNKRHLWWSIGDGSPLPKPDTDDSEVEDTTLGKPFKSPSASLRSVFDLAGPADPLVIPVLKPAASKPALKAANKVKPVVVEQAPPPEPQPELSPPEPELMPHVADAPDMRVAIWSDGAIQIRRGDADVAVLTPGEARQVLDALDRMLAREVDE